MAIDFIAFAETGDYPVGIDKGNGELVRLNLAENIQHIAAVGHSYGFYDGSSATTSKSEKVFGIDDNDRLAEFDLKTGEPVYVTGIRWGIEERQMAYPFVESEILYAFARDRVRLAIIDEDTGEVIRTGPDNYGLLSNSPGTGMASVFKVGNTWYCDSGSRLYSINLSTLILTHIGSVNIYSLSNQQSIVVVNGTAYGLRTYSGSSRRLATVDVTDGSTSYVNPTGLNAISIYWIFVHNNRLYGLHSSGYLVEFNLTNGSFSQVGSATQYGIGDSNLDFPFVIGTEVFALSYTNQQLVKFNMTTGVVEIIGVYRWHQNRNDIVFPIEAP